MKKIIRLGTRGSPLALLQAEEVRKKLVETPAPLGDEIKIEIVPIRTTGDWRPEHKERTFIELGGNKGLFTKEIEEALQGGHIDMAVHSMKDVASFLPDSFEIAVMLKRIDARDAFISQKAHTLDDLPPGSVIGTSSLRRQSQILARRPDLRIVPLRGNVDTRLKKLSEGIADATLLAVAGLQRLGLNELISSILDTDIMLPAAAQGAVGVEIRKGDDFMRSLLEPLNSVTTSLCVKAEREVLKILDGSCHTPIGAFAKLTKPNHITVEAVAAKADGTSLVRLSQSGSSRDADAIAIELGHKLKSQFPANFFAA